MKLYVVFGVEFHVGRELLGVYGSNFFALSRQLDIKDLNLFDDVIIQEITLNENLQYQI